MPLPLKKIVLALAALLAAMGFFNGPGAAQSSLESKTGAGHVLWNQLRYRGNHFLGKVETVVSLAGLPAKEARKELITSPEGQALEASGTQLMVIAVQSTVEPLFGVNELTGSQAWLKPDDAAVLQRIRLREGDDIWQNTYRFTDTGVYRLRKKPGGAGEQKLAPEHWTKIKASFYPYQDGRHRSQAVLEPTGLLYLVSAPDFIKQTTPRSLDVFDRKQLHQVQVQVGGHQRLKVSYLEKTLKKEIRREGMIDVVRIVFKPRALVARDEQPEEFSFMGLKGDFEIYIDGATGVPVQVSGEIPGIGKLHIRLHTVAF